MALFSTTFFNLQIIAFVFSGVAFIIGRRSLAKKVFYPAIGMIALYDLLHILAKLY